MEHKQSNSPGLWAVVSVLLGILVAVLGFFALLMWVDAHQAKDAANRAADKAANADSSMANMPGMSMPAPAAGSTGLDELTSYAGAAPANADALAAAHKPFPAALPAALAGPLAKVNLLLKDITIQVASGVKYSAWAWAGGAPGPVIHVRQGQMVKITLTNGGAIPHSVDFHAARVAPDKAFADVMPGKSVSYKFRANDAGVFM
jgi:nitrite reductase (NO-forming)